jgi:PBS lyase HEAT-like repeat
VTSRSSQNIAQALARLTSLHDGYSGVSEVVTFGKAAVPALRGLLFHREPSGLFQIRCRAVEALAALRAYDVLVEFLNDHETAVDSIECLGDDAVINAVAQGLRRLHDERVFRLLLHLAQRPALTGVIDALGAYRRVEAIPALIAALEDDASRGSAEAALLKMARAARTALIISARQRRPPSGCESESSLRRRRSALKLLSLIGISRRAWLELRGLVWDKDPKLSFLACRLGLPNTRAVELQDIVVRLLSLWGGADWMLRDEIEQNLVTHFDKLPQIFPQYAGADSPCPSRDPDVDRLLRRVRTPGHR